MLFLFIAGNTFSQYYPLPHVEKESPFDTAAVFPGGSSAMMNYFRDSCYYPEPEFSQRKSGNVLLKFEIDTNGQVHNIHIINGVAGAPNFVAEARRVVSNMPVWKPAVKNNFPVNSEYTVSFPFILKHAKKK